MSTELKVPTLPESVADASIAAWHKKPGDEVKRDEVLVDVETDKVVLEVPAPHDGVLESILQPEGSTVTAEQVLGMLAQASSTSSADATTSNQGDESTDEVGATSPAVRQLLAEHGLNSSVITGTGSNGRISKEDVLAYIENNSIKEPSPTTAPAPASAVAAPQPVSTGSDNRTERRVPMTRLRVRIADRLLQATQQTAMLTTFNEINMKPLMDLRSQFKDSFEKSHNVKLGFMSMFVKAATEALKRYPDVNASIDGHDIVYHGFCDVGVAVSSERGLVVPVLRDADHMSLAEIEGAIASLAVKAKNNKLSIDDMTGGTFTISNGGVFGSLFSTPILNPPQSAILGMHTIQKRPVVENDEIVIRPMMYIAMSYDHRIIDGKGAVTFLKTIKELVEEPAKILLDI